MGRGTGQVTNACGAAMRDHAVLVTGAAGFLGRNLCRALRVSGSTVLGIDDFSAPDSTRDGAGSVDQVDVLDLGVRDLVGVTTVIHLAARKSVPASFENRDDIARNVLVDRHLVEIVARGTCAGCSSRVRARCTAPGPSVYRSPKP